LPFENLKALSSIEGLLFDKIVRSSYIQFAHESKSIPIAAWSDYGMTGQQKNARKKQVKPGGASYGV
jgi:hypothetical protein